MSNKSKGRARSADDMLAAFLITFTAAVFRYEVCMPEKFMKIFNAVVFISFAAAWCWLLFRNGNRMKIAFPVFTALFWLLPYLIIFLKNDGPEIFRFSIIMYVLSEFLGFLVNTPIEIIGGFLGLTQIPVLILILILSAAAYTAGIFFKVKNEG